MQYHPFWTAQSSSTHLYLYRTVDKACHAFCFVMYCVAKHTSQTVSRYLFCSSKYWMISRHTITKEKKLIQKE